MIYDINRPFEASSLQKTRKIMFGPGHQNIPKCCRNKKASSCEIACENTSVIHCVALSFYYGKHTTDQPKKNRFIHINCRDGILTLRCLSNGSGHGHVGLGVVVQARALLLYAVVV